MAQTNSASLLNAMQTEHDDLLEEIKDVEQFWTEVNELGKGPKYEEMAFRVHRLRDRLKRHFAEEERDGYLSPVIAAAPELAFRVNELKQQHQEFLKSLDQFSKQLKDRESAIHNWEEVHQKFDDFLGRLHEHESAEMGIVREASA